MKSGYTSLLPLLVLFGCFPRTPTVEYANMSRQNYVLGVLDSCTMGESVVTTVEGYGVRGNTKVEEGVRRELIYTGLTTTSIAFMYREYNVSSGSARIREAYSLPITYPNSYPSEISFQEFRINLKQATPSRVIFTVHEDGGHSARALALRTDNNDLGISLLPVNKRRHIIVSLFDGTSYDGFVLAEDNRIYYLSSSKDAVTVSRQIRKMDIERIVWPGD